MYIIWSGKGLMVPILLFLYLLICGVILAVMPQNDNIYIMEVLLGSIGIVASVHLYKYGRNLHNLKENKYEEIDASGNHKIKLKQKHTFFFIKIEYWRYITIFYSIVIFLDVILELIGIK